MSTPPTPPAAASYTTGMQSYVLQFWPGYYTEKFKNFFFFRTTACNHIVNATAQSKSVDNSFSSSIKWPPSARCTFGQYSLVICIKSHHGWPSYTLLTTWMWIKSNGITQDLTLKQFWNTFFSLPSRQQASFFMTSFWTNLTKNWQPL